MKRNCRFLAIVLCAIFACGCTKAEKESLETSEENIEVSLELSEPLKETESLSSEEVLLSDEEKLFFTNFIQERENYGFLLSYYDIPEDVNLNEVFYIGADIGEPIPEEDISFYLSATNQEFLELDCIKLTKQDMEEFLQRKLGIKAEDANNPLQWIYLPEMNSYYHEAGDTNYALFTCVEGKRQKNIYTLHFTPEDDGSLLFDDCETVIIKTEDEYRFVSNRSLLQKLPPTT